MGTPRDLNCSSFLRCVGQLRPISQTLPHPSPARPVVSTCYSCLIAALRHHYALPRALVVHACTCALTVCVGLVLHRLARFEFFEYAHPTGGYAHLLSELFNIGGAQFFDGSTACAVLSRLRETAFAPVSRHVI